MDWRGIVILLLLVSVTDPAHHVPTWFPQVHSARRELRVRAGGNVS